MSGDELGDRVGLFRTQIAELDAHSLGARPPDDAWERTGGVFAGKVDVNHDLGAERLGVGRLDEHSPEGNVGARASVPLLTAFGRENDRLGEGHSVMSS